MSEDLDALILKKETELRPYCTRMEELRLQFIEETAKFAIKWFESTAKLYVTKNPEITLNLSAENLARMKMQVNELTKNAHKIVKNALTEPHVWWHLAPDKDDAVSQYDLLGDEQVGNRFPEAIDKPVRCALGELGKVLEKFGYNVTTGDTLKGSYPEFWFERGKTGLALPRPYFPHLLDWSVEMLETLEKYNVQYKRAYELLKEIVNLKDEKKKKQAGELWDSA